MEYVYVSAPSEQVVISKFEIDLRLVQRRLGMRFSFLKLPWNCDFKSLHSGWGTATNQSSRVFGVTVAGEFATAINNCGLW